LLPYGEPQMMHVNDHSFSWSFCASRKKKGMVIHMNIRPVSKCQNNFNEIAELCRNEREPVFITKNGYEDLVLIRAQDFARLTARIELYDKLAVAQKQVDENMPVISHDELFSELKTRLHARG